MYHYEGYVAGRQRLVDMAYFVLTLLEQRGIDDAKARGATKVNKLQAASQLYGVDPKVLRTLGRLSTVRGDDASARKFDPYGTPLTPAERQWIDTAVRALIRRVGEHDYDPRATQQAITIADLPALTA